MTSPLESLDIFLTAAEVQDVLNRVEERAIEEAEDDQPASQPSDEYELSPRALVLALGAADSK
jgi:hypothetical protein